MANDPLVRNRLPVLWISSTPSHYRIRGFSRLAATAPIDLTVVTGMTSAADGFSFENLSAEGTFVGVDVPDHRLAFHARVYWCVTRLLWRHRFPVVVVNMEKKYAASRPVSMVSAILLSL